MSPLIKMSHPLQATIAFSKPLPSPPRATPQPEPSPSRSQDARVAEPQTLTFQAAEVTFSRASKEGLCPAQLAFLERKSRYASGGPHMPPESVCAVCGGAGKLRCTRCDGGGFNKGSSGAEILGLDTSEGSVICAWNGRVDVNFFLAEDGLCVLCRGLGECGCHLCEGSGFAGGITSKFCGD